MTEETRPAAPGDVPGIKVPNAPHAAPGTSETTRPIGEQLDVSALARGDDPDALPAPDNLQGRDRPGG